MTNTTHILNPQAPSTATSATSAHVGLLRMALRENAVFSVLSGAGLAIGAGRLDTWLGVNTWLLVAFGVALVLYGDAVWLGSRSDDTLALTGRSAVIGDLGWLIGAIVLITATSALTRNGEIALAVISVPVGLFAIMQIIGLNRLAE